MQSEVISGVQAAGPVVALTTTRSPRRAHHDALTTTRSLTFRYGPCSLMRSRALRLNPQWPACLSITRRSRTQSGNLTEPLMRNAVILALSDVGDGLAACALLLHAHEPSLVTDTPPSCVRLGCAHLALWLCPAFAARTRPQTTDYPLSSLPFTLGLLIGTTRDYGRYFCHFASLEIENVRRVACARWPVRCVPRRVTPVCFA